MSQEPMISLKDIHLTLKSAAGPVNILRGIDLTVQQGEAVGIVGPSGSGKSTLMSIMAGLEVPSAGSVSIAGKKLETMGEDALARFRRENIGIVFQSFHLIPTMTALENVAIPLELAGEKEAFALAAARLEAVGLADRATHYPAQLSGGEQQRVALARALSTNPKILLADEPTGNLDGKTGDVIVDLMFRLHEEEGTTMVLITHDDALAKKCNHQVRLEDGRVVSTETSREEALAGE
ncbi:MAG: ABC transporter ATP-binding protein [Sneathiella sp.]